MENIVSMHSNNLISTSAINGDGISSYCFFVIIGLVIPAYLKVTFYKIHMHFFGSDWLQSISNPVSVSLIWRMVSSAIE